MVGIAAPFPIPPLSINMSTCQRIDLRSSVREKKKKICARAERKPKPNPSHEATIFNAPLHNLIHLLAVIPNDRTSFRSVTSICPRHAMFPDGNRLHGLADWKRLKLESALQTNAILTEEEAHSSQYCCPKLLDGFEQADAPPGTEIEGRHRCLLHEASLSHGQRQDVGSLLSEVGLQGDGMRV